MRLNQAKNKLDGHIQNVVSQSPLNLISANNQWESWKRPGRIGLAGLILGSTVISGKLVKLSVACMLTYAGVDVHNQVVQMFISTNVV